jgi:UDP-2,3-diacylglucosamine pyrophosphatase LpxH
MKRYKSIWISDLHLGTKGCKADDLCKFLKYNVCDHLYLVGDIIDGWKLTRSWNWPQSHSNVVRRILTSAKRGTKITWITGNHDEFLRDWIGNGLHIGDIKLVNQCDHIGVDGKIYLIVHGDMFDAVTRNFKWLSLMGDVAYELLISVNAVLNKTRKWFGYGYWSLSRYIKINAKQAANFIFSFEKHLAKHALDRGYHGVFCGHIHMPEIKPLFGIIYLNDGCWVENCSAIVEEYDGIFNLLIQGIDGEMHIERSYNPITGDIT